MRKNSTTDGEKAKWAEGGEYKVLLHVLVGGIMSDIGGNGFASGAVGAGMNQAVQKELANITDPGLRLIASSLIGATAAKIVGGNAQAGASAAFTGTKYNDLAHRPTTKGAILYAKSEEDGLYHYYVVDSNGGEVSSDAPKAGQVYWDEQDGYERVQGADGKSSYFTWKYVNDVRVAADDNGNAIIVNGDPVINPTDLVNSPLTSYSIKSSYETAYRSATFMSMSLQNVDVNDSSNAQLVANEVEKQRQQWNDSLNTVVGSIGGGGKVLQEAEKVVVAAEEVAAVVAKVVEGSSNAELHHIASDKSLVSGFTAQYEKIFKNAGMAFQDDANLIFLEDHSGAHTKVYKQYVLDYITNATDGLTGDAVKDALTTALNDLKEQLIKNNRMPYKGGL